MPYSFPERRPRRTHLLPDDPLRTPRLRGLEIRSSSLRCGFVFVDEATEQVSALNVVEIDVGL